MVRLLWRGHHWEPRALWDLPGGDHDGALWGEPLHLLRRSDESPRGHQFVAPDLPGALQPPGGRDLRCGHGYGQGGEHEQPGHRTKAHPSYVG